jgi:thioredoxin-related protein
MTIFEGAGMGRWRTGLIGGLILACQLLPAGAATDLPLAVDLRAETREAAAVGAPVIVIYSRKDCKYCETVKRDYLKPLLGNPRYREKIVIRQVNQDSDAVLIDFKGASTTHERLALSEKIKLVPVVAFYGPDGRKLAEPIIGARLADFYLSYLEDAIEQSRRSLKKP